MATTVTFRTQDDAHYLTVLDANEAAARGLPAGILTATADRAETWETFEVVPVPGGVALKSWLGLFLSALDAAECSARGLPVWSVVASAAHADIWETWTVIPHGGGVALRSHWGLFLSPQNVPPSPLAGGGAVLANGPELGDWERLTPSGPLAGGAAPSVPGSHPDPLLGQLRVDGGAYADDSGPRLPVFLHLGDLIGHGLVRGVEAILPALDFARDHGYHGIRSWFQLLIPSGTWLPGPTTHGWDPRDDRGRFHAILAAAAERGLKWHIAGGGTRGMGESDERDVFACLSDAIAEVGPQAFALVEGINEARDTARLATPPAWQQVVAPIRARFPEVLVGLSAYTGHENREPPPHDPLEALNVWTPNWMRHYVVHGYRGGRAHDKIRHIFSLGYDGEGAPTRRLGWQGEPWGPGRIVSAQAGHHEIDADVMILGACMAAMARQAWVVMSGPGVVYQDERLEDMPGLAEVPGVVRQLPQDLMRFPTLGHSGPSQRGKRIHAVREDARDVREDYAIASDGRFVAVRYGPPEQPHDLPQERIYWDGRVHHEGAWGKVFSGRLS